MKYWTISTILVGDWIFIYLTFNSNILIKFSLSLSLSRSLSLAACYFSQLWPCCVVMSCGVDDGDSVGDGDYDDIVICWSIVDSIASALLMLFLLMSFSVDGGW